MNFKKITYPDVNNGLGCRITLWCCGCTHHCPFCQNKELWDESCGKLFTNSYKEKIFEVLSLPYMKGLTLSGGDPMAFFNYKDVIELSREVKERFPDKDIWLYTGFEFSDLQSTDKSEILDYVDYVVDGRYEDDKRDLTLKFRGSSNQKIWKKIGDKWIDDSNFEN